MIIYLGHQTFQCSLGVISGGFLLIRTLFQNKDTRGDKRVVMFPSKPHPPAQVTSPTAVGW